MNIYGGMRVECGVNQKKSYICNATGKRNTQSRKVSSSIRDNLDNFQQQMDYPVKVCLNVIIGIDHIGRICLLLLGPVQRLSNDRQIPAFLYGNSLFGIIETRKRCL